MKNQEQWLPTKYSIHRGHLRGSRNRKHLHVSSRLITDRVAAGYDRMIKEHARGDLLDLGCGQVPLYETYRPLASSVTCVDWPGSPHDVQHADVLCDINEPLPIPSDSFDTVICSDVLEHLHSPELVVGEIRRVLRPGGKVLLSVPFMYGLHEQPHDYHRYTRFAISHLCDLHGLRVIELIELGGAGDVVCNLIGKLVVRVPVVGDPITSILQSTWNLARKIGFLRRMDQRTSAQFPLEYFAVLENEAGSDR